MSSVIPWIAAEAEGPEGIEGAAPPGRKPPRRADGLRVDKFSTQVLPAHQFPAPNGEVTEELTQHGTIGLEPALAEEDYASPERRAYRGRTAAMLRRYMRYSIETGRLPSLVGREFFRSNVTKYRVNTFEDRVIFVHDMENCLAHWTSSHGKCWHESYCRSTSTSRRRGYWGARG